MAAFDRQISGLAVLDDPVRRSVYEGVVACRAAVSKDEAAAAAGISRSLASYHLDRLVDAGLLTAEYRRLGGRSGPGAGRPSKLYHRSAQQVDVSLPPRRYDIAAAILLEALVESGSALEEVEEVARRTGREIGAAGVEPSLQGCGFEPSAADDGSTLLCNCPFAALAERHRETTCRLNHAFVRGILEGARRTDVQAVLRPDPELCCVRIEPMA